MIPESKYSVGDIVIITKDPKNTHKSPMFVDIMKKYMGMASEIVRKDWIENKYWSYRLKIDNRNSSWREDWLLPVIDCHLPEDLFEI